MAGVHGVATPTTNSPVYSQRVDATRRAYDISKKIAYLVPESTPFTAILMRARKEVTNTQEFFWYDHQPGGWWSAARGATADPAETVIPVSDASVFRARDVVKNTRTGELYFVTAISEAAGANTITVTRSFGTTAAAAILDEDDLMRLGNAMEQFSTAPAAKMVQPTRVRNYTQIFRRPFDQSMTSAAEPLHAGTNERQRLRKEQAIEHRLDIERAICFGEPVEVAADGRSATGGIQHFLADQVFDAEDAFSEAVLDEYCEELFEYGSPEKILVCSRRLLTNINAFAADRIETTSGEQTYGLRLKKYMSAHGDLYLVPSKTLERDYKGMAFGLDMKNIAYRPLKGRDTMLKTNIQANDADGWRDEYLTEAGLELRLVKTHLVLTNADTLAD
jgi:hypothetical protein